jgi:hypothetical protein
MTADPHQLDLGLSVGDVVFFRDALDESVLRVITVIATEPFLEPSDGTFAASRERIIDVGVPVGHK